MDPTIPEADEVAARVTSWCRGVETSGVRGCPACGTSDTGDHYGSLSVEKGTVVQSAACDNCGAEWDETYVIDHIVLGTPPHLSRADAHRYPSGIYWLGDR